MAHIIIQSRVIPKADYYQEPVVEITQAGGSVTVTRKGAVGEASFTIDASKFKPFSGAGIYWSQYGEFIYVDDLYENRDKDAFMRYAYACHEGALLSVGWGETPDQLAVVSYTPTVCVGEFKSFPRNDRSANFIDEVIPGFAAARTKYVEARTKALRDIVPLDSIADLEKQVDMLSELVFLLADELPAEKRPVWLDRFKDVVSAKSSAAFKSAAQNIDDIEATKSKVRDIQVRYFTEKF